MCLILFFFLHRLGQNRKSICKSLNIFLSLDLFFKTSKLLSGKHIDLIFIFGHNFQLIPVWIQRMILRKIVFHLLEVYFRSDGYCSRLFALIRLEIEGDSRLSESAVTDLPIKLILAWEKDNTWTHRFVETFLFTSIIFLVPGHNKKMEKSVF
jgi:hypothetical protein